MDPTLIINNFKGDFFLNEICRISPEDSLGQFYTVEKNELPRLTLFNENKFY